VEECDQFRINTEYFKQFSNLMDVLLIVLHIVYVVLRLAAFFTQDRHLWHGAVNTLIFACIVSWIRFMEVFTVTRTFGPFVLIVIELFRSDVLKWIMIFLVFSISFQLGFTSLALQANFDPLTPYDGSNGTFPVSYFAIVGSFDYLMPMMSETYIGVFLLGIYAFIAQIMLVNLLIAMMSDTFTKIRCNSDQEWMFYRLVFFRENKSASPYPPPLNLIYVLFRIIFKFRVYGRIPQCEELQNEENDNSTKETHAQDGPKVLATVDKLIELKEKEDNGTVLAHAKSILKRVGELEKSMQILSAEATEARIEARTKAVAAIQSREDISIKVSQALDTQKNSSELHKKLSDMDEKMAAFEIGLKKLDHLDDKLDKKQHEVGNLCQKLDQLDKLGQLTEKLDQLSKLDQLFKKLDQLDKLDALLTKLDKL